MSPVAAYYIFVAQESERASAWKRHTNRSPRPSVMERLRRLAAGPGSAPQTAASASG